MLPRFRFSVLVITPLLLSLLVPAFKSQSRPPDPGLVLLNLTVRTRTGNYATGLNREAFEITDEKEKREIEFFESSDTPVSVGLLVDTSGSMQLDELKEAARLEPIGEAILDFLNVSNSNNEYFVAAFDSSVRFLTDWKSGPSLASEKTPIETIGHSTAMYDACLAAIEKLKEAHQGRRVIVLMSDGLDNNSRHTFKQLQEQLRTSDATLYAMAIQSPGGIGSTLGYEGRRILEDLSEPTGGQVYYPETRKELRLAMNLLATQLRHQYRIGFRPASGQPPNKWHRVRVRINLPPDAPPDFKKLNVLTRQGYYTR